MSKVKVEKYKEALYPELRKLIVERQDTESYYANEHECYDTNYCVYDKNTKEIISFHSKAPCFADLVRENNNETRWTKDSNLALDIYINICHDDLDPKLIHKFFSKLRRVGKLKYRYLKNFRMPSTCLSDDYVKNLNTINLRKPGDIYVVSLNYSDYKSMEHMKIVMYLVRYIYEYDLKEIIENYFEFESRNKRAPFLSSIFNLSYLSSSDGHNYYTRNCFLSDKQFIDKINSYAKDGYKNNAFSNFCIDFSTNTIKVLKKTYWGDSHINEPARNMPIMNNSVKYNKFKRECARKWKIKLKELELDENVFEIDRSKLIENGLIKE